MVDEKTVRERIRVRFGTSVADRTDLVARVASRMDQFIPGAHDFAVLKEDLRQILQDALGAVTKRRRSNISHHYTETEIDEAADELTVLLIEKLRVCEFFYKSIHDFYMKTGSMRTSWILRTKYKAFLQEGEAELLETVASENDFI